MGDSNRHTSVCSNASSLKTSTSTWHSAAVSGCAQVVDHQGAASGQVPSAGSTLPPASPRVCYPLRHNN